MNEIEYSELFRQPYGNGKYISAGIMANHPDDTVYLEFGTETGGPNQRIWLRPDEAATIVWLLGACLYSECLRMDGIITDRQATDSKP